MYFKIIKQKFKFLLAKIFISILAQLSLKACHRLGSFIGWVFTLFSNRNRHVSTINIQMCFPDMKQRQQQQLINKSLIETGKTLAEASPMWQWNKNKLFHLIKKVHGEELIQQAINNKQGVILALPHLGNWELLGLYCSSKYPTTSMYQKPKMQELDAIVKNGRERLGAKLVPTDNQGVRAMLKALKNNELVCILPDQEPSNGNGLFSPFFGIQAYSMTLISRLANKTNSKIIIAYTKRLEKAQGYEIVFSELNNQDNTEEMGKAVTRLNSALEESILQIPEQYQWSYKRFRKYFNEEKQEIGETMFYKR